MQIDVQALGFELTPALREHTAGGSVCLRRRVGRSSPTDEPGVETPARRLDRGRIACGVRITLTGAPEVLIEDTEADLYVAIDRAADRAGRTVARRLERSRDQRHGPPPSPAIESSSDHPIL